MEQEDVFRRPRCARMLTDGHETCSLHGSKAVVFYSSQSHQSEENMTNTSCAKETQMFLRVLGFLQVTQEQMVV